MNKNTNRNHHPSLKELRKMLEDSSQTGMYAKLAEKLEEDPLLADALEGLVEIKDTKQLNHRIHRIKRFIHHKANIKRDKRLKQIKRRSRVKPQKYSVSPHLTFIVAASVAVFFALFLLLPIGENKIPQNKGLTLSGKDIDLVESESEMSEAPMAMNAPVGELFSNDNNRTNSNQKQLAVPQSESPLEELEVLDEELSSNNPTNHTTETTDYERVPDQSGPQPPIRQKFSAIPIPDSSSSTVASQVVGESLISSDNRYQATALITENGIGDHNNPKETYAHNYDTINYPDLLNPLQKSSSRERTDQYSTGFNELTENYVDKKIYRPDRISEDSLFGVLDKQRVINTLMQQARILISQKDYVNALKKVEEVLEGSPDQREALFIAGYIHKQLSEQENAIYYFKILSKLGEGNYYLDGLWELSLAYQSLEKWKNARKLLNTLSTYPEFHERAVNQLSKIENN